MIYALYQASATLASKLLSGTYETCKQPEHIIIMHIQPCRLPGDRVGLATWLVYSREPTESFRETRLDPACCGRLSERGERPGGPASPARTTWYYLL